MTRDTAKAHERKQLDAMIALLPVANVVDVESLSVLAGDVVQELQRGGGDRAAVAEGLTRPPG